MGDLKHQKTFSTKSVHVMAFLLFFGLFFFTISKNTNGDLFLNTKVAAAATPAATPADIIVNIDKNGEVIITNNTTDSTCVKNIFTNLPKSFAKNCMSAVAVSDNVDRLNEDLHTGLVEKKIGSCDYISTSTKIYDKAIGKSNGTIAQCEKASKSIESFQQEVLSKCDSSVTSVDIDQGLEIIQLRKVAQKGLRTSNIAQKVEQAGTLKNLGCHIKNHKGGYALGATALYFHDRKKDKKKNSRKSRANRAVNARKKLVKECALAAHGESKVCREQVQKVCYQNSETDECQSFTQNYCGDGSNSITAGSKSHFCVESNLAIYCSGGKNSDSPGCAIYNRLADSCKQGAFLSNDVCRPKVKTQTAFNQSCVNYAEDPFCKVAKSQLGTTSAGYLLIEIEIVINPTKTPATGSSATTMTTNATASASSNKASIVQNFVPISVNQSVEAAVSRKLSSLSQLSQNAKDSDVVDGYGDNIFYMSSEVIKSSCSDGTLVNCGL